MSDYKDEFVDDLVKGLSNSPVLIYAIVDRIKKDEKLLAAALEKIDPDKLAHEIASQIAFQMDTKRRYNSQTLGLAHGRIMKEASSKASDILADLIAKDTDTA